jgi:hypothetical protein
MRIQTINVPMDFNRYAPEGQDSRMWVIMRNDGSGANGVSQARKGDVTCMNLNVATAAVYTDSIGTRLAGISAIQCETTNAPIASMLGAWHDTPKVGKFGRVQCSGWDDDARILSDATMVACVDALATTGQPYVTEAASITAGAITFRAMCLITEPVANRTAGGPATGHNRSVVWACV